jgi:phosphomannomutase/phosphoglucomutase
MTVTNLPKEIFRAYDIRGLYPSEINEHGVELVGKALGTLLHKKGAKTIIVGTDNRESSSSLANSMMTGLLSTGINVISNGITVEPACHYFTFLKNIDASVNITASHNPGQFNGIKVDFKHGEPLFGDELASLYDIAKKGDFKVGKGEYKEESYNQKYIDFVSSKFKLKRKIKVVVYCGNGATSEIYPTILENIGAEVEPLRCYLDSDFPNGVPDPESGNFYPELIEQVLESKAELGVGFDGDGDRVGETDEKGNQYKADEMLLLFSKDVLSRHKGATIIFDVKCSQTVENYVKSQGGKPRMMRTGRSFILNEMYSGKALLGGELSGHIYFKDDYFGYDDGIYATCRLLKIMDETGLKLSKLMAEFPKMVSTPELKVTCPDKEKFGVVAKIVKDIKANKSIGELNETDGARVKVSETGWFLIRASNTSPYLSVRAEGKDAAEVGTILELVAMLLSPHNLAI